MDIRQCLKPAIDQRGLKQYAVAKEMGVTEQQLSDIINLRRKLEANELISFCETIKITPNDLLSFGVITQPHHAQ